MEETSFLSKYGASIIAVSGTLLAAFMAHAYNWLSKKKDYDFQENQAAVAREIEFRNRYVIEPTIIYLQEDLKMAQAVYAKSLNNLEIDINCNVQGDMMHIAALIGSLDVNISEMFHEYTIEKIRLNTRALAEKDEGKDIKKAYDSLRRLECLASEIIKNLCKYSAQ